jgi:hypothetical protein
VRQARPMSGSLTRQPIFYPVLNEDCATKIARDWNVAQSGSG